MVNKLLALFVGLILLVTPAQLEARSEKPAAYDNADSLIAAGSVPLVLLLVSRDIKMFRQAYPGLADYDGDGRLETGFNPAVVYVGYFDSYSCYTYIGDEKLKEVNSAPGDESAYFARAGGTIEDEDTVARPSGLPRHIISPRSVAGICRGVLSGGERTFSGNWLNYLTTSRIDAVRRILYGGYRSHDAAEEPVVLEVSAGPPELTAWGTEIMADNLWAGSSPLSPYFDIGKYTPFDKPELNKAHFFVRTGESKAGSFPLFRILPNVDVKNPANIFKPAENEPGVSSPGLTGHYWDWILRKSPGLDDQALADEQLRNKVGTYKINIQTCLNGNIGLMEKCLKYPNGSYKPAGLLQEQGSGNKIYFGLLSANHGRAGEGLMDLVENHLGSISESANSFTGEIIQHGLIDNLNKLEYNAERGGNSYFPGKMSGQYRDAATSEMLYEALRYFSGLTAELPHEQEQIETPPFMPQSRRDDSADFRQRFCYRPVLLLIGDSSEDGMKARPDELRMPLLKNLKDKGAAGLPDSFNETAYLERINDRERLSKIVTALKGNYSAAAVAYFARTHNFGTRDQSRPIELYAVNMGPLHSGLTIAIKDSSGRAVKNIFFKPAGIAEESVRDSGNANPGVLDYYAVQWESDKRGQSFSLTVQVDFVGFSGTKDRNRDPLVEYKIDLLTSNGKFDQKAARIDSGDLHGEQPYYLFKSPGMNDGQLDISPEDVAGLRISTRWLQGDPTMKAALGYNIKGTAKDGTYLDIRSKNGAPDSVYLTPSGCSFPGAVDSDCRQPGKMAFEQYRSFSFADEPGEFPPDPLWLAAKYGGYNDLNNNGYPDPGEWDNQNPGTPDNYFQGVHIINLPEKLRTVFKSTSSRAGAGSASSVSFNPLLGGGISIQTMFFSEYTDITGNTVKWPALIYGLFIDKWGNLREDSNGDGRLTVATGSRLDPRQGQGDKIIKFNTSNDASPLVERWRDIYGGNDHSSREPLGMLDGDGFARIRPVWNTVEILAEMTDAQVVQGRNYQDKAETGRLIYSYFPYPGRDAQALRAPAKDGALYEAKGWAPIDLDAPCACGLDSNYRFTASRRDNIAYMSRLLAYGQSAGFISSPHAFSGPGGKALHISAVAPLPASVQKVMISLIKNSEVSDVNLSSAKVGNVVSININYNASSGTAKEIVERINSQTDIYGAKIIYAGLAHNDDGNWVPDESIDTLLDIHYISTASTLVDYILGKDIPGWRNRTVYTPWNPEVKQTWRMGDIINSKPVIVGPPASNFDLLYGDLSYFAFKKKWARRRQMAYFGSNDGILHAVNLGFYGSFTEGLPGYSIVSPDQPAAAEHALGAEVWGYIPTAALPHLRRLPLPDYSHNYYVDLKPQIADIKNNSGKDIIAVNNSDYKWADGEWRTVLIGGLRLGGARVGGQEPEILNEFFALDVTDPERPPVLLWRFSHLGLGYSTAQPAVVSSLGKWYVVLGSGPENWNEDGQSSKGQHQAGVFIVDAVSGELVNIIHPESSDEQPEGSFFTDAFTVIDTDKMAQPTGKGNDAEWNNPALYLGMAMPAGGVVSGLPGGALYRLQMIDPTEKKALPVKQWKLKKLINTEAPIMGAVNVTYDSRGNIWIVFGSGQILRAGTAEPCASQKAGTNESATQCGDRPLSYLYGVKELAGPDGGITFAGLSSADNILDVTKARVYDDGTVEGLPDFKNYEDLRLALSSNEYGGYKRALKTGSLLSLHGYNDAEYEIVTTQPKLDALSGGRSNMVLSSYQPSTEDCEQGGRSYLHVLDTFTGLPAPYMASYGMEPGVPLSGDKHFLTGAIRSAGLAQATEAWILKTDRGTIYGNNSANGARNTVFIPAGQSLVSSIISWREVTDMGFSLPEEDLMKGIEGLSP